jgi:hypothetical protein
MISSKAIAELRESDGVAWITALKRASIRALVELGNCNSICSTSATCSSATRRTTRASGWWRAADRLSTSRVVGTVAVLTPQLPGSLSRREHHQLDFGRYGQAVGDGGLHPAALRQVGSGEQGRANSGERRGRRHGWSFYGALSGLHSGERRPLKRPS